MLKTPKRTWVTLEGTDGVGKTAVATALQERASPDWVFLTEFSSSPVGDLIRSTIEKKTIFRIDDVHRPFAETLLLASDLVLQVERVLAERQGRALIIISDRGPDTFLTYQVDRIKRSGQPNRTTAAIDWVRSLFAPIGFPTASILLISSRETIERRLEQRGARPSREEMRFIMRMQSSYVRLFRTDTAVTSRTVMRSRPGNLNVLLGDVAAFITHLQRENA